MARGACHISSRSTTLLSLSSARLWILCLAAAGTLGCGAAAHEPTVPEPALVVDEPSVRPGINEPYLRPDALDRLVRYAKGETEQLGGFW